MRVNISNSICNTYPRDSIGVQWFFGKYPPRQTCFERLDVPFL